MTAALALKSTPNKAVSPSAPHQPDFHPHIDDFADPDGLAERLQSLPEEEELGGDPSLLSQPIQFYSCFISAAPEDEACAKRLYADLQAKDVRCWYAPEDLKTGDLLDPVIDKSIRQHDKLLLLLSKHSVTSESVKKEVRMAVEKERKDKRPVLFPIRLDDAVMKIEDKWPALIRDQRYIRDFSKWKCLYYYQEAFEQLLQDLKVGEKTEEQVRISQVRIPQVRIYRIRTRKDRINQGGEQYRLESAGTVVPLLSPSTG